MRNKKNIIITLLVIAIILITSISFYYFKKNDKFIKTNNLQSFWIIYDLDLEIIEKNLDEITISNDDWNWWELKSIKINDEDLLNIYNSLISDIRMCYIQAIDDDHTYTNSNPVRKYENAKKITKKELETLQIKTKNDNCLNLFDRYNNIFISNNEESEKKVKEQIEQINSILESKLFIKNNQSFDEIVSKEIIKIHLLAKLSDWLKSEYYIYK